MDDPGFIPFLISIPIGIIVAFVYLKAKVRYEERAKERAEVRVSAEEIAKERVKAKKRAAKEWASTKEAEYHATKSLTKSDVILFLLVNALIIWLVFGVLIPSDEYGELFSFRDLPEKWSCYSWVHKGLCVIPITMVLLYYNREKKLPKLINVYWALIYTVSCIFCGVVEVYQNVSSWDYTETINWAIQGKKTYGPTYHFRIALLGNTILTAISAYLGALLVAIVIKKIRSIVWRWRNNVLRS